MGESKMAERQFVIFTLNENKYGVDISDVSSIIDTAKLTSLPDAPYFIQGIYNLRGSIIPIVNLKKRFKLDDPSLDEQRILVISTGSMDVGFIVDSASQTIAISESDIMNAPEVILNNNNSYIKKVLKTGDEIVLNLDLKEILTREELIRLKSSINS